jgi:hypothetical protein
MQHEDILLTLAEVATAFAGFASLISVFRKRGESTIRLDAFRFRGVLENCLLVLAFSLLPLIVNSYGLREGVSWQISSIALLTVYGFTYIVSVRRLLQLLGSSWIRDWPVSFSIAFVLGLIFISATFLNVFSLTPQSAPALYLTALCCPLLVAGMLFMHFVLYSVEADLEI